MPGRGLRNGIRTRYRGGRHSVVPRWQFPFKLNVIGFSNPDILVNRQILPETTVKKPARSLAVIDELVCMACGKCADVCPFNAILMSDRASVDISICKGCGKCISACPVGAIRIEKV